MFATPKSSAPRVNRTYVKSQKYISVKKIPRAGDIANLAQPAVDEDRDRLPRTYNIRMVANHKRHQPQPSISPTLHACHIGRPVAPNTE